MSELEELREELAQLRKDMEEQHSALFGMNPQHPGMALRVDRLERLLKLVQVLATSGIFWQLLQVVGEVLKGLRQ